MPKTTTSPNRFRSKLNADLHSNSRSLGISQSVPLLPSKYATRNALNTSNDDDKNDLSIDNNLEHNKNNDGCFDNVYENVPIYEHFIDTLNMTEKQSLDLNNVQNMFYYLRPRVYPDEINKLGQSMSEATISTLKKTNNSSTTHQANTGARTMQSPPRSNISTIRLDPLPTPTTLKTMINKKHLLASTMTGSVYDLELVDAHHINKDNYYTISARGITLFQSKESYFTSIIQYDREFLLFQKICRIKFFKLYRRWKVSNVCTRYLSILIYIILLVYTVYTYSLCLLMLLVYRVSLYGERPSGVKKCSKPAKRSKPNYSVSPYPYKLLYIL